MSDLIIKWFPIIFGLGVLVTFSWVIISGTREHLQKRRILRARREFEKRASHEVTAMIMDKILPMERRKRYGDPLDAALLGRNMGLVVGGGTQQDHDGLVDWIDIQIALVDLDGALEFTRNFLRECGAPAGSVLRYLNGNQKLELPIV